MATELTLARIPKVLDDEELPFVLRFGPDQRRSLVAGGAEYRRGTNKVLIDWTVGAVGLRAILMSADRTTYLLASAGPLLNEWWPLLQRGGASPDRPVLSGAIATGNQTFQLDSVSINVSILPPGPGFDATTAVMGLESADRITQDALVMAHGASLAVIKAALLIVTEYRTLVNPVPDVPVDMGGTTIELSDLLDLAQEAADSVAWKHSTT